MNRLKTGINGLDHIIVDGIPEGSNLLLYGPPGSGKTIMGIEFLYKGVSEFNENGLYVTLEESKDHIFDQAKRFGWDLKKYVKKCALSVLDFKIDEVNRDFAEIIIQEAKIIKAKRIVIDSLELLSLSPIFYEKKHFSLIHNGRIRTGHNIEQFTYNFIHILESTNATKMFITRSTEEDIRTKDGISEYICDGIIHLRSRAMGKAFIRTLEVLKMRRTKIKGGIYVFDITDSGLVVRK